ncbi:peroxin [Physocladia obscura]|uniref:Peroxin n=1 Tax=Physocladia obscura TaxID=109957 RepID=A0AAD5T4I8_9FUNG|nr:peroxin [Physocladia obscura]
MTLKKRLGVLGRIAVGTCAVAIGVYGLYRYAMLKVEEADAETARIRAAKQNLTLRFNQNLKDSRAVVAKLAPVVASQLTPYCNVEEFTAELQQLRLDKKAAADPASKQRKAELWESLKIAAFTRAISALYLINLLNILTLVQLSVLAKFSYICSVSSRPIFLSSDTERMFLTLTWYLLHKGIFECTRRVKEAVEFVFTDTSVSTDVSCDEFLARIISIRISVEGSGADRSTYLDFSTFLLPPTGEEKSALKEALNADAAATSAIEEDETLSHILNQTREFLERDTSFDKFEIHVRQSLFSAVPTTASEKIEDVTDVLEKRVKLASSLPTISKFSSLVFAKEDNIILEVSFNTEYLIPEVLNKL